MSCPSCGNANRETIETNGCRPSDPDLTLLCVARVTPEDSDSEPEWLVAGDYDENGLVICGAQWCPNEPR